MAGVLDDEDDDMVCTCAATDACTYMYLPPYAFHKPLIADHHYFIILFISLRCVHELCWVAAAGV